VTERGQIAVGKHNQQVFSMSDVFRADPTIRHHLDDPITQHMRREYSRLHVNQTVAEALEAIRCQTPEGRVSYFYVVDDDNRLQGVVPTRRLLLSPLDKKIADIMVREVIIISQHPARTERRNGLLQPGFVLRQEGRPKKAIADYTEAIRLKSFGLALASGRAPKSQSQPSVRYENSWRNGKSSPRSIASLNLLVTSARVTFRFSCVFRSISVYPCHFRE